MSNATNSFRIRSLTQRLTSLKYDINTCPTEAMAEVVRDAIADTLNQLREAGADDSTLNEAALAKFEAGDVVWRMHLAAVAKSRVVNRDRAAAREDNAYYCEEAD